MFDLKKAILISLTILANLNCFTKFFLWSKGWFGLGLKPKALLFSIYITHYLNQFRVCKLDNSSPKKIRYLKS